MHKTTIFIIQLCVVVELFAIKRDKTSFPLKPVKSGWVAGTVDIHAMECAFLFGSVCGKSQHCNAAG